MSSLLHLRQIISSSVSERKQGLWRLRACAPAAGALDFRRQQLVLTESARGEVSGTRVSIRHAVHVQFQLQSQWAVFEARIFGWVKISSSQKQIIIQCGVVIRI